MKFRLEIIRDIKALVKELTNGLRSLTFEDNFQGFEITTTIAANTEVSIRNQLTKKASKYIILKQTGNALVTAGDTEWTDDFLYMKNHDASNEATVTIQFLR